MSVFLYKSESKRLTNVKERDNIMSGDVKFDICRKENERVVVKVFLRVMSKFSLVDAKHGLYFIEVRRERD